MRGEGWGEESREERRGEKGGKESEMRRFIY